MTHENVAYGDHPQQVIDFWQAKVAGPAPLILFIHGGGCTGSCFQGTDVRGAFGSCCIVGDVERRQVLHARRQLGARRIEC